MACLAVILFTEKINAQGSALSVQGKVLDEMEAPMPGVSVLEKGSANGVVTDVNGTFSITLTEGNAVLVFSFVGYQTQEVMADSKSTIDVRLVPASKQLNEVVVVGYGVRTKLATTGAIASVKSDVFENRPLNNAFDALQGNVPGMTITRASGQPGQQGYTLQVRGYSSINNISQTVQPLILIDGIPGDLSTINPNDISQLSVLKDAAAAIYGARAANGVILVTTKAGKKGAPTIDFTMNMGIKAPTYLRKIQNTLHYAEFQDEGLRNVGIAGFPQSVFDKIKANSPPDISKGWNYGIADYPGFYGYTDWNKVVFKEATQQLYNLSISGGGDNTNYLVSFGYNKDDGNLRFGENSSDRYNLRLNYNLNLRKNLTLDTRSSIESTATKEPTMLENALQNVPRQFPYQPVYNQAGQFYGYQGYENPAQSLTEGGLRKNNLSRIKTNFKLDYRPFDGFTVTGQAAIQLDYFNDNRITQTLTRHNYIGGIQDIRNRPNEASYENKKTVYQLFQLFANYKKQLGRDHTLDVMVGSNFEKRESEGQTTTGYNFPSNDIFTLNLADRTKVAYSNFTGLWEDQSLASFFGRFSYSFQNKWVLDISTRADGSSKFAPTKRWSAIFPSAAIAYNLSEENFIRNLAIFDLLKLRVSWGRMGNQELSQLGLYDYIPLVKIEGKYPLGSPNAGLPGAVANPASSDRTWETIETRNLGVDWQVLDSRLSFSFDYFSKTNANMLVAIAAPATFGASPPSSNQGKLETNGFETTVTWRDRIKDFNYSISMQLSDSKNKLVELKNSDNYQEGLNQVRQGYPIYSYFGYVYEGIIKTPAQLNSYKQLRGVPNTIALGDVMYKDVDGDGELTAFGDKSKGLSGDMVYLGNLLPRYTYSSNINLSYKQFDLSLFLQGVGMRNIQYEGAIATPNTFFWPSLDYYYGKTWTSERSEAKYPRYVLGSVGFDNLRSYNYHTSSLTMQNVSYLRFKTITVGYNLPPSLAGKIKLRSLRIYFSGQDMFTISGGTLGDNFDPEDGFRNERTYPFNKIFSIGLNAKF